MALRSTQTKKMKTGIRRCSAGQFLRRSRMKRAIRILEREHLEGYQRSGYRKHEGQALHNTFSVPTHEIQSIDFEPSTSDEIRHEALSTVRSSQMYRRGRVPARFGLLDMRMGSRDPRFRCATCGESSSNCNGHMGCLDLAMPVYNPHYLKHVQSVLQSICVCCMRPRISSSASSSSADPGVAASAENHGGVCAYAVRVKDQTRCLHSSCGALHPTYRRCANTYIRRVWSARAKTEMRKTLLVTDPKRFKILMGPLRAVEVYDSFCVMESLGLADTLRAAAGQGPGTVRPFTRFLFDSLPVSPVSLRPTVMLSIGSKLRSESEQTIVYQAIVKENAKLIRMMLQRARAGKNGAVSARTAAHAAARPPPQPVCNFMDQSKFREVYDALQAIVAMFVSSSARAHNPNISRKRRSGETRRSLSSYLTGKIGLLRSNVQGKRGNNGARTVITGDPHISVDVVTVPQFIATRLHRTERVTRFNLARMRERVLKGPGKVGGAHKVMLPSPPWKNGERAPQRTVSYSLWRADRKTIAASLAPGYVVVRYLETGDRVLFNRQPSLSRKSMMVFRVMVVEDPSPATSPHAPQAKMPRTVFGMHLSVTTAFNADFDGDEMNIHLLNSHEAVAEGQYLASVTRQVTNELNSKTTLAIVQDSVLGAYLLSRSDQWFTRDEFMQLTAQVSDGHPGKEWWVVPEPDRPGSPPMWSGKQVLSSFMPPVTMRIGNFHMSNGTIKSGNVTKQVLNGGFKSILYKAAHYCGDARAVRLAEDLQRVTRVFLLWRGGQVSIGADDLMAHTRAEHVAQCTRRSAVREACAWGQRIIRIGIRERVSAESIEADAQAHFGALLRLDRVERGGSARDKRGAARYGALETVVDSGSKGSWINLAQMRTCVGQQSQNGSRLGVLPADAPDDPRLSAHENAPYSGAGGGARDGGQHGCLDLIDILEPWSDAQLAALRASPRARGFVASSFRDGLGMAEFFYHSMSGRVGVIDTSCKTAESGYLQRKLCKALEDLVLAYDYTVRDVSSEAVVSFLYGEGDGFDPKRLCVVGRIPFWEEGESGACGCGVCERWKVLSAELRSRVGFVASEGAPPKYALPFEPQCLWDQVRSRAESGRGRGRPATRAFVETCAADLLDFLARAGEGVGRLGEVAAGGPLRAGSSGTHLSLRVSVARHMCPSRVLPETKDRVLEFVDRARYHFYRALACAGDSVGASAATSLGASLTQSTLNTFHFAGVAEKRAMTLGIPRYKELVNASSNISNAYVDIPLRGEDAHPKRSPFMQRALWPQVPVALEPGGDVAVLWESTLVRREHSAKRSRRGRRIRGANSGARARFVFVGKLHPTAPPAAEVCRRIREGAAWGEDPDLPGLDLRHRGRSLTAELIHPDDCLLSAEDREAAARFLGDAFEDLAMRPAAAPAPAKLGAKTAWEQKGGSIRVLMSGSGNNKHSHRGGGGTALVRAIQRLWTTFRRRGVPFDFAQSYSNDVFAVCASIGVEAARAVIEREFATVLCSDGTYISRRHVVLAADFMTSRGVFTGMTRHDYKRSFKHRGPLARACFEQPVDVLVEAAASSETDAVQTASARVMVGRRVQNGTGAFSVLTDADYARVASNYGKSAAPLVPFSRAHRRPSFSARTNLMPSASARRDRRGDRGQLDVRVDGEGSGVVRSGRIESWSGHERKRAPQRVPGRSAASLHDEDAGSQAPRGDAAARVTPCPSTSAPRAAPRDIAQTGGAGSSSRDDRTQNVIREHAGLYAYENLMRDAHLSFAQSRATPLHRAPKLGRRTVSATAPSYPAWLSDHDASSSPMNISEDEGLRSRRSMDGARVHDAVVDSQSSGGFRASAGVVSAHDKAPLFLPAGALSTNGADTSTTAALVRPRTAPWSTATDIGTADPDNGAFGMDSAIACAFRASTADLQI